MKLRAIASYIVYEIDDQIFLDHELEQERVDKLERKPSQYHAAMSLADQFIVSTRSLRDLVEHLYEKPAHILQNVLCQETVELSKLALARKRMNRNYITIGYAAGSATHDNDFKLVQSALNRVLLDYREVRLLFIGHVSPAPGFLSRHAGRIEILKSVSWKELPEILARFDIQIIPLEDVPFNSYKSHVRFLESAAVGCPAVMSNVGEQSLTVLNGHHGLLIENGTDAWYNALSRLIVSPEQRNEIGGNAQKFVWRHYTSNSRFSLYRARASFSDILSGRFTRKISIIMECTSLGDCKRLIELISKNTRIPYELHIWNTSSENPIKSYLDGIDLENVMIVDVNESLGRAVNINYFVHNVAHRFVCCVNADSGVFRNWDLGVIKSAKVVDDLKSYFSSSKEQGHEVEGGLRRIRKNFPQAK